MTQLQHMAFPNVIGTDSHVWLRLKVGIGKNIWQWSKVGCFQHLILLLDTLFSAFLTLFKRFPLEHANN